MSQLSTRVISVPSKTESMCARRNSNSACILLNRLYIFYVGLCFIESKAVKYDLMNLEMCFQQSWNMWGRKIRSSCKIRWPVFEPSYYNICLQLKLKRGGHNYRNCAHYSNKSNLLMCDVDLRELFSSPF